MTRQADALPPGPTRYGYMQIVRKELYDDPAAKAWHERHAQRELLDMVKDDRWVRLPIAHRDQPMRWVYGEVADAGSGLMPTTWDKAEVVQMRWTLDTQGDDD
jgi:hypothetical protein